MTARRAPPLPPPPSLRPPSPLGTSGPASPSPVPSRLPPPRPSRRRGRARQRSSDAARPPRGCGVGDGTPVAAAHRRQKRRRRPPTPRSPHQVVPELLAAHIVRGLAGQRPRHGGPRRQPAPGPPASHAAATGAGDNSSAPPPGARFTAAPAPPPPPSPRRSRSPLAAAAPPPSARAPTPGLLSRGGGKAACRKARRWENRRGKLSQNARRRVAIGGAAGIPSQPAGDSRAAALRGAIGCRAAAGGFPLAAEGRVPPRAVSGSAPLEWLVSGAVVGLGG